MAVQLITLTIKVPRYARCYLVATILVYATRIGTLLAATLSIPFVLEAISGPWKTFIPPHAASPFFNFDPTSHPFHVCPASEPGTPLYVHTGPRTPAPLSKHGGEESLGCLTAVQTATQAS